MTTTTLRVGTWNILGRRRDEQPGLTADGAVQRTLNSDPVDVLCLQEVHFYDGQVDPQLRAELCRAGLEHFVGRPLSPSHLDARAELGVAIAARFPLSGPPDWQLLENPGLRARVRGADWILHDKGFVGTRFQLEHGSTTIKIYSLHLFPFFEFGVGDHHDHVKRMWSELWEHIDKRSDSGRVILAGDYNQAGRAEAADEWSQHDWMFCVPGEATTRIGLSLDDIAINWPGTVAEPRVVSTFSDHHLVIAELEL